ncbi:hypothetical protein ACJMK2_003754 [Sinanodonta woodiana]|uniref:G-protein coupled receptors family 1 profile domain-containing protein n=1 Tax=Sinanodonta woodiana TaxID=1069815 RepID=A0ABD3Y298_SINWO
MKSTTTPRLCILGSIFLSAYIVNRCQYGEAGFVSKVFESSTVNYTRNDGGIASHSEETMSVATRVGAAGALNHSTREGHTDDYHSSTETIEVFTISNASVRTSPTKISILTTHGSERISTYEVTGQQGHTAETEYVRQNSIDLSLNAGNNYISSLATIAPSNARNESNSMEAETVSIATVSETFITKSTVQTGVLCKLSIFKKICIILSKKVNPVICGIGILCNVVNLFGLCGSEMSDSPYIYLTALAISDMGVLVMVFVYQMFIKNSMDYASVAFGTYAYYPLVNIFMFASIWVTCALTLERIVYIKRPLLARSICTRKRAKCLISCIIMFDIVFNVPRFFFYRPVCQNIKCSDARTAFNEFKGLKYISWTYIAIVNILPLTISITSNVYMTRLIHVSLRKRQIMQPHTSSHDGANQSDHTNKLTIMLTSIVFVFILCTFPSAFSELQVSHALFGGNLTMVDYYQTDFYNILLEVSNSLALLNNSLNFFLYCAFSDKFRNALQNKMMHVLCKK